MDLAKRGRSKVILGDCVSISSRYFGDDYAVALKESGLCEDVLIGRIVEVVDGNRDFSVKWDIDNQISKRMSLDKVKLESRDRPRQDLKCSSVSVITAEDFQDAEQGPSNIASESHALVVEEFDSVTDDKLYHLLSDGKKCFTAKMYSSKPGSLVHNKELLPSQCKFRIDKVLDTEWGGFDEDIHSVGSFVAWEVEDAVEFGKGIFRSVIQSAVVMDLAKRGRSKVILGDCVSISSRYFGDDYAVALKESGLCEDVLIGRIVEVVDGNRDFSVKWDIDNQISKRMSLDKVKLESRDRPRQDLKCSSVSVITAEDFQDAEQGPSNIASESHALVVEEFDSVTDDKLYHLLSDGKKCFTAKMYSSKPGSLVHNKELLPSQCKFRIDKVLDTEWGGFDEDIHSVGSFVAWEVEDAVEFGKGKKRKFELRIKNREEPVVESGELDWIDSDSDSGTDEYVERVKRVGKGRKKKVKTNEKKGKEAKKTKQKKVAKEIPKEKVKEQDKEQELDKSNKRKKSLGNVNQGGVKSVEKFTKVIDKPVGDSSSSSGSSSEEEVDRDEKKKAAALQLQSSLWKKGGWTIDPAVRHPYGPKLHLDSASMQDELSYLIHFLPIAYIRDVLLRATNEYGTRNVQGFTVITFEEFMIFHGLVYAMEVVKLPERRMYWKDIQSDVFPKINFGNHMARNRFEEILGYLQFSFSDDKTKQILDFLEAVNNNLHEAISAGHVVCIDESMIKAFHRLLPGKIKIRRKPRPIGNEIKDMSDASSMVVIRMELYEGKDAMATKDHVQEYGATCATTLRLSESIKGTGRVVVGDSWFGSVKTAVALKKIGLYSILLVKTAHANYPKELLNTHKLARGEWVGYTAKIDDVDVMAVTFQDLKRKQFISTCETVVPGKPRVTKHHGNVPRPKVAETYLKHADSIDKHNSVRTGSMGLEDVLHTHSPHLRQFFGILGFLFTNAFLAYRFFKPDMKELKHVDFKMVLAERLVKFQECASLRSRLPASHTQPAGAANVVEMVHHSHQLEKLPFQKPCYYCRHGYTVSEKLNTTFKCSMCQVPLHKPSFVHRRKDGTTRVLDCWNLHIVHGKPQFRRSHQK